MRRARRPDASRPGIILRQSLTRRAGVLAARFQGSASRATRAWSRFTRGHRPSRRVRRLRRARGSRRRLGEFRRVQLKQVLRLLKSSPRTPWVLIEAPSRTRGRRRACPSYATWSEFERLGYRWARGTVAPPVAFREPGWCSSGPSTETEDVLLTEDAGAIAPFDAPGPDQAQAFVFNRQTDGRVQVPAISSRGSTRRARAASSCGGGLTRWRCTTRAAAGAAPGLDPHLAPARDRYPRGQLPAVERARGVDGMRSGDAVDRRQAGEPVQAQGPRRLGRSLRVPDHGPVAAVRLQRRRGSMRGGRVPFPEGDAGGAPPPAHSSRRPLSAATPPRRWSRRRRRWTTSRLFAAGWQPPPQLIAVEVAAGAAIAAAAAAAAAQGGMPEAKPRRIPALQDPVIARAAAGGAGAVMAAVQAADAGASMAGLGNPAAALAAAAAAERPAPGPKSREPPRPATRPRKNRGGRGGRVERTTPTMTRTRSRTSRFRSEGVAGCVGEAPRTPFWPA